MKVNRHVSIRPEISGLDPGSQKENFRRAAIGLNFFVHVEDRSSAGEQLRAPLESRYRGRCLGGKICIPQLLSPLVMA